MNTNDSSGSRPFAANFQFSFAHVKLFKHKFGVNFKQTENYGGVEQKKVTQVIVNEMAIQCYAVATSNGATSLPALQVSHEYAIVSSGCLRSAMIGLRLRGRRKMSMEEEKEMMKKKEKQKKKKKKKKEEKRRGRRGSRQERRRRHRMAHDRVSININISNVLGVGFCYG